MDRCPRITRNKYDPSGMYDIVKQHADKKVIAYLEKAQAMPTDSRRSAFNYGKGFGYWEMALIAAKIPYVLVTPRKWKNKILAGMDKADKASSILVAKRLFPNADMKPGRAIKDDHNMAEALLVAVYGGMDRWGEE